MKKFGLIGHPIEHSMSPTLFDAGFTKWNAEHPDDQLSYDLIEGQYFEESYVKFMKGYQGINITAPFKEKAYEKAEVVSGPCMLIGAANILVKTEEGVACHNSDFSGVILTVAEMFAPGIVNRCYMEFGARGHIKVHQAMKQILAAEFATKPKALIVGLGGAGSAAAVAAAEMGYQVIVWNRTVEKAEKFIKGLPEFGMTIASDLKEAFRESQLIIYCLPVKHDVLDSLTAEDYAAGGYTKMILEANYRNPSFTDEAMDAIDQAGALYISGKKWLLYQAVAGYPILTGEVPSIGAMADKI